MNEKKITALKQQKRNPKRINVYLDGKFAFGLDKFVAAWLTIGDQLDGSRIQELQDQDSVEAAYQKGLQFISYRPRSIQETRKRLNKKGIDQAIIEEVINRLIEKKFLNDHEFADLWVENRMAFKPRSRYMLRGELIQKGISDAVIETVLAEVDDSALAYQAAKKKAHRFARYEWEEFRKKLGAFLGRRGFPYSTSEEACQKVWAELQSETQNA